MDVKVLGISTSPRIKGNSDLLLRQALAGAKSAGASTEYVRLADYKIGPCIECNDCYTTGRCSVQDDYQQLLSGILDADRLIFATPVFFMTVCAQAKTLIDSTHITCSAYSSTTLIRGAKLKNILQP
jgi:multimeric flavodoxin WrbA